MKCLYEILYHGPRLKNMNHVILSLSHATVGLGGNHNNTVSSFGRNATWTRFEP